MKPRPRLRRRARALAFAFLGVVPFVGQLHASPAAAQTTAALTNDQRRAYLYYYAPVLLKRGDENNGKAGRDWMTNFDFDRDGVFGNNRVNWTTVPGYAGNYGPDAAHANWQIRPTMYTSLIEFTENGSKSLVLLYHVYNASDKDAKQIHDWERIEIVVRNVSGVPGGGAEAVSSSTLTLHEEHIIRRPTDFGEMNFLRTPTGNHLLVWQADESDVDASTIGSILGNGTLAPHAHELHFVSTSAAQVAQQLAAPTGRAEVRVSGSIGNPLSPKNVHYVFVPERSSAAVGLVGAQTLNAANARYLASRVDNGDRVGWNEVKRLTYELQDLADITATQWSQNPRVTTAWQPTETVDVLLESPIVNESGVAEVPAGRQIFYSPSYDTVRGGDGRGGYIKKVWLWGAYSAETNPDLTYSSDNFAGFAGIGTDSFGFTRGAASGRPESHGQYWWQHDFFVHDGQVNKANTVESGSWLRGNWWTAANGGFDGRWVQLFDDGASAAAAAPLQVSITAPAQCVDIGRLTARIVGGQAPYTVTWSGVISGSGTSATADAYTTATAEVRDAAGGYAAASYVYVPTCGGGISLQ